jgi:hypothetical protein
MESSIRRRKEKKEVTFLGKKRASADLSENFIFRQTFTGTLEGEYEKTANIFRGLCAFDWEDEKIVKNKLHPCKINFNF